LYHFEVGINTSPRQNNLVELKYMAKDRYYTKTHLPDSIKEQLDLECLSEYELFESNHDDVLQIDNIIGEAKILTIEEFDQIHNL
jgi:hypothetical protein